MTCGIYIITNNITGKQYVGQSIHIDKRIKEHIGCYDIQTSLIEKSIRKHGWENFTWNVLYECSEKYLDIEERKFIALYNTYHDGYNLTRGGDLKGYANPMHDPILKQKNIEARKGFKFPKKSRIQMSKKRNGTGFYRVQKEKCPKCKQGFIYRYDIRKQNVRIRASDIFKLKEKILKKGYEWYIINQELAEKTIKESESKRIHTEKEHPTGYFRVIKRPDESYTKGYYYRYNWSDEHGKAKNIQATTIAKLKEKVLTRGLEWIELKNNDNHENELTLDSWL